MVNPATVVDWMRAHGVSCKKVRGVERWDCKLDNVELTIESDRVLVSPLTDYGATAWAYCYGQPETNEVDWLRCREVFRDYGFDIDILEETGAGKFVFIYPLDEYRKAFELAKILNEEDLWVNIRVIEEVQFRKGDNFVFDSVYDFVDYLKKLLKR